MVFAFDAPYTALDFKLTMEDHSVRAFQVEDVSLFRKGLRLPGKDGSAPPTMGNATFQQFIGERFGSFLDRV